jgi:hypothetical protein
MVFRRATAKYRYRRKMDGQSRRAANSVHRRRHGANKNQLSISMPLGITSLALSEWLATVTTTMINLMR